MDFTLTEEQKLLQDMCRSFADNELKPKAEHYDKTHEFPWEHVKGFARFKPQYQKRSCPLGWGWSDEERQAIVDSDLLSVLIFFNEGKIVNVVDFRNDRVAMEEFESGLTPQTASFSVKRTSEGEDRYEVLVLRP